jgi:hypothetical protein
MNKNACRSGSRKVGRGADTIKIRCYSGVSCCGSVKSTSGVNSLAGQRGSVSLLAKQSTLSALRVQRLGRRHKPSVGRGLGAVSPHGLRRRMFPAKDNVSLGAAFAVPSRPSLNRTADHVQLFIDPRMSTRLIESFPIAFMVPPNLMSEPLTLRLFRRTAISPPATLGSAR